VRHFYSPYFAYLIINKPEPPLPPTEEPVKPFEEPPPPEPVLVVAF
jgi:hypothetical protein